MGYTVVTAFEDHVYKQLHEAMCAYQTVKIPFGRDCDRMKADRILKYHVTLVHWKEIENDIYYPRLNSLHFTPFTLQIYGSRILILNEGYLLQFDVIPYQGFAEMKQEIEQKTGLQVPQDFLHITLAVDKDLQMLKELKIHVDHVFCYPFYINVEGLSVYHVWKPVYLDRIIS